MSCPVCGGSDYVEGAVLWPALIEEWGLSDEEAAYVDRQQGCHCVRCGANLRIAALSKALAVVAGVGAHPWRSPEAQQVASTLAILDLNGCEGLSAALLALPGYVAANYPDIDMQALPYADATFDFVIHSDTLEHIAAPVAGLRECRRVLKPGGSLCFTAPVIVGRLTRTRDGLVPSYHGPAHSPKNDFLVHSEYGADIWAQVMNAGFDQVLISTFDFPAALAVTAWNQP